LKIHWQNIKSLHDSVYYKAVLLLV